MKNPPVVRSGKHTFPLHTRIKKLHALDIILEKNVINQRTSHKAEIWYHRSGQYNAKALKHSVESPKTRLRVLSNLDTGRKYLMCSISKSTRKSHPPNSRQRFQCGLELVHEDIEGSHVVESFTGRKYTMMFTDDMSSMS